MFEFLVKLIENNHIEYPSINKVLNWSVFINNQRLLTIRNINNIMRKNNFSIFYICFENQIVHIFSVFFLGLYIIKGKEKLGIE